MSWPTGQEGLGLKRYLLEAWEERGCVQRGNNRFGRLDDSICSGCHYSGVLDRRRNREEGREYKPPSRYYDPGLMLMEGLEKVKCY